MLVLLPVGVCGVCAGEADVHSFTSVSARLAPTCPTCNRTVTMRVKIVVDDAVNDMHYKERCAFYDDLVHQFCMGVGET